MGEIFFDVFTLVPRDLIDVRLILLSFIELNEMKKIMPVFVSWFLFIGFGKLHVLQSEMYVFVSYCIELHCVSGA